MTRLEDLDKCADIMQQAFADILNVLPGGIKSGRPSRDFGRLECAVLLPLNCEMQEALSLFPECLEQSFACLMTVKNGRAIASFALTHKDELHPDILVRMREIDILSRHAFENGMRERVDSHIEECLELMEPEIMGACIDFMNQAEGHVELLLKAVRKIPSMNISLSLRSLQEQGLSFTSTFKNPQNPEDFADILDSFINEAFPQKLKPGDAPRA